MPCFSASFSRASVGPKSAYRSRTSSDHAGLEVEASFRLLGRPRLRETRPAAPSALVRLGETGDLLAAQIQQRGGVLGLNAAVDNLLDDLHPVELSTCS